MNQAAQKIMPDFCSRRHPFHYVTALCVLAKMGIDVDTVDILAVGEYENYRGEIQTQSPQPGAAITDDTRIVLKVGYPSAVDYLPYQMFYGLGGVTSRTGEWEDKSRTFMAPFDAAVIRHHASAMYQSLKFSFGAVDLPHLLRYLKLLDFTPWEESPETSETLFWVSIMPSFHFWAGNPAFVEKVLRYFFGYDFRIVENIESEYSIPDDIQSHLGSSSSALGKGFVVGRSFKELDSSYELQVLGVAPEEVRNLLPGKSKRRKLEWVLSTCMPNNLDCRITIKVDRSRLVLGRKGHLGYSTFV
jgi:hypothetical protein